MNSFTFMRLTEKVDAMTKDERSVWKDAIENEIDSGRTRVIAEEIRGIIDVCCECSNNRLKQAMLDSVDLGGVQLDMWDYLNLDNDDEENEDTNKDEEEQ